ncbi:zinc-binding dehydrogenase [Rhodococcus opacus]|uniref:zinc-binding dehydrogenase n=1 Tax=Rhodococcus opacus TaxID=37919 RepID=UPI000EA9C8F4|nr:zinc-binding dehydrogenase [Rhodococcus opacus]QZS56849.1 zinc-binding dehydrogenase [Rhodococcus opacus]RKM76525.1 zinc-binding alcohol dehydrogenase [Rhodococcus opacus]
MKAAVLRTLAEPFVVEDLDFHPPAADRVLVRTHATPFCSTDCTNWAGNFGKVPPVILGHASIGEIVEIGSQVRGFAIGQRVLVPGTPECGTCFYCAAGRPDQCSELFDNPSGYPIVATDSNGETIRASGNVGGYAEMMNISANQIFELATDLPSDVLSLMGCGITTGLGSVFNAAKVQPGESVAVVGCGHLGLWVVQAAKLAGAEQIFAIDPNSERRALALKLGATSAVDPDAEDAVAVVKENTGGRGADHAIEAAGPAASQVLAVALARRAGTVVLNGVKALGTTVELVQTTIAVQGRTIISTQNGNVRMRRDVPRYVRMLEQGLLDPEPIVTGRYRLDQINDALVASRDLRDLSGLLVF